LTHSLIDDAALGLSAAINNKVAKEIPHVTHKISIESVLKERVKHHVSYFLPKHDAFCVLNISISQDDPNKLFFEAYAELNKFGFQEADLDKINIEDFMLELYPLRPVVTEGLTHYFDSDEIGKCDPSKPITRRTFKIRYRVLCQYVKIQDITDYKFDEMSEMAFPYIKSLYDVFKIIHPNPKNLKGDVN